MKRFLLITCACLIFAAPASANLSRSVGMGGIGLYLNDDTNVLTFPQSLADYSNRGILEMGFRGFEDSERSAGAHLHLPKIGAHMAMYVNQPGPQLRHGFMNLADHARHNALAIANEEGRWGIMVGFGADTYEDKFETDPADGTLLKESVAVITATAGMDFDFSDAATGELGVRVGLNSGSQEYQGDLTDDEESNFELGVTLRNTYDRGENGDLVVLASGGIASGDITFSVPNGDDAPKDEVSGFNAGVGAAWHYPVAEGITVIPGVELFGLFTAENTLTTPGVEEEKFEQSTITYFSPFFAMEAWINSWWVARVGVKQSNTATTFKDTVTPDGGDSATDETTVTESQFDISLGVGIKLGENFMIDGLFNEDLLYNGPNFLTGDSINGSFISRLSIWGWW